MYTFEIVGISIIYVILVGVLIGYIVSEVLHKKLMEEKKERTC